MLALSPIGRITDPPEDIHEQILRDAVDFAAYPNASARSISWDITKLALSNVEKLDAKTLDKIGIVGNRVAKPNREVMNMLIPVWRRTS